MELAKSTYLILFSFANKQGLVTQKEKETLKAWVEKRVFCFYHQLCNNTEKKEHQHAAWGRLLSFKHITIHTRRQADLLFFVSATNIFLIFLRLNSADPNTSNIVGQIREKENIELQKGSERKHKKNKFTEGGAALPSQRGWQPRWAAFGFLSPSSPCQRSPDACCSSSPSSSLCAPSQTRPCPACPEIWCAASLAAEVPGRSWGWDKFTLAPLATVISPMAWDTRQGWSVDMRPGSLM